MPPFQVDKFELQSVSGMAIKKVPKRVPSGVFGRKHKTIEIEESHLFSIETIQPETKVPSKDQCRSYTWTYSGTLHLAQAFVYLSHNRYAVEQEFTCFSLHVLDHICLDINTRFVSLHINSQIETPRAAFEFSELKEPHSEEWQELQRVKITFQDKVQMQEYIKILEPADSVVLAKLGKL
jgi:hypothetical protein